MRDTLAKQTIRWKEQTLMFTVDEAASFYVALETIVADAIGYVVFSTEKRKLTWNGNSYRFTPIEVQSLRKVFAKFLAQEQSKIPLNPADLPEKLQRSQVQELFEPLDYSPQMIGRIWSVLCTEMLETRESEVWCSQCQSWAHECTIAYEQDRALHFSARNHKLLELPVKVLIDQQAVFDKSNLKNASTRVKEAIRIIIQSIEDTVA